MYKTTGCVFYGALEHHSYTLRLGRCGRSVRYDFRARGHGTETEMLRNIMNTVMLGYVRI